MATDGGGGDSDESDDGGGFVCGYNDTSTTDDSCQFPVAGPDQRCHMHPRDGSGPPEGHGSGTTSHSMGAGNGDIQEKLPDGAKPAMDHGLHAVKDDPHGTLDWLEDNDLRGYDWVQSKWESYLQDAPFPVDSAKADDVLHAVLMLYAVRGVRHRQISRGLSEAMPMTDDTGDVVRDQDGEPFEIEQELPVNLPANRIAREARSTLKTLGVMDDPESKKAEAMGWGEAAKRVAKKQDDDDSHD